MKASDLFLRCLEAEGVEVIFGVPGEENADLMIGLLDSPIRFIMCRHEQGAAFMADLYGRLTGRPGVCLGTLGPGAANLVTGVANAHFDRSPLVAITGQGSIQRLHKESHQNQDVVGMFQPITKWATSIRHPDNIPETLRKAFRLAAAEKPGATHVELPEDIAKMEANANPIPQTGKFRRPAPNHKTVGEALELIRGAQRPIVLAGNGCIRKRAGRQLARFVNNTGVMVAHTFMGKGAISASDPHSLMVAGLGSRDHITEAFQIADLVITIGYDMIEWHPDRWNPKRDKKILHIDFEPAEVDDHYPIDVEMCCDIAESLWALNEGLEKIQPPIAFDVPEHKELRRRIYCEIGACDHEKDDPVHLQYEAIDLPFSDAYPMKPQRILRDLRKVMADNDILISDVGAHKMWVARHFPTRAPGTCIISNGYCSMGIAVPGAISAQRLFPDRKTVAVVGDGGFMMNMQEVATAVEHKIPAIFLIWEDNGFGLIAWKQTNLHHKTNQVTFQNPDFLKLAEGFGAFGRRVGSADDFIPALEEAYRQTDRPSIVVVPVDYSENVKLTDRLGRLVQR